MNGITTEDGKTVHEGERVFNYYDGKWGTIRVGTIDREGWFDVDHDDGTSSYLNGARVSTFDPNGSRS